ncbi:hypothetical protein P4S96_18265, partial [Aneurinibacillus thermoaerophilus]|nr:hypothetical protein [Aneurinibacillus thermoaerophilus]
MRKLPKERPEKCLTEIAKNIRLWNLVEKNNKKLAELQRKMSKCQKYSRQWKRYNRAKQYLLSKSKRKKKRSRCHNQRMSQWQVGKVKKYLTYKLKAEGIML